MKAVTEQERIEDVMSVVGRHFGVSASDLASHRRTGKLHGPRLVAVYLSQRTSGAKPASIGKVFGGRDRTIIEMYCRAIERRLHYDRRLARIVQDLEQLSRSGSMT